MMNKLKEKEGSTVISVAVLFFAAMLLFAGAFEYVRIQIIAWNLHNSFENATRTVASENYNEIYAGFRENIAVGGEFEGGPEGGGDEESPEWVNLNDEGNVTGELQDLLGLEDSLKSDSYTLKDIETKAANYNQGTSGKYEVQGKMKVIIPIRLVGIIINPEVPIKVKIIWNEKY